MTRCYCCGAEVPDDAKFCAKCGKPLEITQDLIDRAEAGDSAAQTELYQRTYKIVYAKTRAKVSDEDAVMDIMQETYLRAFTNLDQLKKAETFPSWLLTIASRQACDWYRKNGKEQQNIQLSQLEYEDDDTFSDEDDLFDKPEDRSNLIPDEALDRAETGRLLSEILDTLPEDQRMILTMYYYDDMSLNEISEELGVNLSTVKSRLTAGKKKVKAKVLELEKSGTKLYSLGPVAFLVYLLRHAELFAPEISSNTILGLTGTGAAAAAGGTAAVSAATQAAAGVAGKATAGAAVKAAVGVAVKSLGFKIAAVAAAVAVAGGATVAVVTSQPSQPSSGTVMEIAEDLSKWIANSDLGSEQIELDFDMACELSAALVSECGYTDDDGITRIGSGDYDGYLSVLSGDAVNQCLHNIFGSDYQSSDFHNHEMTEMIRPAYSEYSTDLSGYLTEGDDGDLLWYYTGIGEGETFAAAKPVKVTDISSVDKEEKICTATVEYDLYLSDDSEEKEGTTYVTFWLKYDENSEYQWVVTSIQQTSEIETTPEDRIAVDDVEPATEDTFQEIVDSFAFWSVNDMYKEAIAAGPIVPTVNEAAELAAAACYFDDFNYLDPSIDDGVIPEEELSEKLNNLFGPEYQLSEFTNTVRDSNEDFQEYISAFPENKVSESLKQMTLFKEDDQYRFQFPFYEVEYNIPEETVITKTEKNETDENIYYVTVEYDCYYRHCTGLDDSGEEIYEETSQARDVEYELMPCEESDYGWIISQITYKGFHEPGSDQDSGDIVYAMSSLSDEQQDMLGAMDIFDNYGESYSWHDSEFVTSAFNTLIRYNAPHGTRYSRDVEGIEGYFDCVPEEVLIEAAPAMFPDYDGDFSQYKSMCEGDSDLGLHFQDGIFFIYINDGGRGALYSQISYWAEHADGTCTVEMQYRGDDGVEAVYRFELVKNEYTESLDAPYYVYTIASMEKLYDFYGLFYPKTSRADDEVVVTSTVNEPSEDDVLNLAELIVPVWGANAVEYNSGRINLDADQAVEMATLAAYLDGKLDPSWVEHFDSEYLDSGTVVYYIIPATTVQTYMTKLFGSQYQLSDFSNTDTQSTFMTSISDYDDPVDAYVLRDADGDFDLFFRNGAYNWTGDNISVESIVFNGTDEWVADVQFDSSGMGGFPTNSETISFNLVEDPSAEFGWAITSVSLG